MINFLLKGLIRDKNHSLFPILIITIGVAITVVLTSWINGIAGDMILNTAKFQTGHIKIVTNEYAQEIDISPIEYSIIGINETIKKFENLYPDFFWVKRINFGGIIDVPDEKGETKEQGYFGCKALDFISKDSKEIELLGVEAALRSGRIPKKSNEIILSLGLFEKLKLNLNENVTLISTSMEGGMSMLNFEVVGTISFGIEAIDRQMVLADLSGIQDLLYMDDSAGEILGFRKDMFFQKDQILNLQEEYNSKQNFSEEFALRMLTIRDQQGLGDYMDLMEKMSSIFIFFFIFIMSIVLWNSGLLKGIRKYGEFGIRLAIGESKLHIFLTLIIESILVGVIGTLLGTILGLGVSYYLQEVGLSFGDIIKNSSIMISNTVHARISTISYFIGLVPGLLASVAGAMLAGRDIYKRETSQLFKELEQ